MVQDDSRFLAGKVGRFTVTGEAPRLRLSSDVQWRLSLCVVVSLPVAVALGLAGGMWFFSIVLKAGLGAPMASLGLGLCTWALFRVIVALVPRVELSAKRSIVIDAGFMTVRTADSDRGHSVPCLAVADIIVRRFLLWHELVALWADGREAMTVAMGSREEVEALRRWVRPCFPFMEDARRVEAYPSPTYRGWGLPRCRAIPGVYGVTVSSHGWWTSLARWLLVAFIVEAPIWMLADGTRATQPLKTGEQVWCVLILPALALSMLAFVQQSRTVRLGAFGVGRYAGSGRGNPDVKISGPRTFRAVRGVVYVVDEEGAEHRLCAFENASVARWACGILEIGMTAHRNPRVREIPAVEALPLTAEQTWQAPPATKPEGPVYSPAVSEKWGRRYSKLVAAWRAMYASDRRWWRRCVEGPPFHMLPRELPRRKFRL